MIQFEKFRLELKRPLLIIKADIGFLACGYINHEACNKTGDACAIVTGVSTHDEMLKSPVVAVSDAGSELGIEIGETGNSALAKMSALKR